jgi:hypothetical protein
MLTATNLGLVMADQNPLGYVFRDEGPYMNPPLQGIMDMTTWLAVNKKPIGIGVGVVGAAFVLTWLLYQVGH